MASKLTSSIFVAGSPVFEEEGDIEVGEISGLAMIKTLEVFYKHNPKEKAYLLLLSKSYANYAFGFLENRLLQYKETDPAKYEMYLTRAKLFYSRGRDYGMKYMHRKDKKFEKALKAGLEPLRKRLRGYWREDTPGIFWLAFAWGSWINLNKELVEAVGDLALVEAIMSRIVEVHPSFFYGSPMLFYGVYYASRPAMLGGDPVKAKEFFDKAAKVTGDRFLMVFALEAQFLAVLTMDRTLFNEMVAKVKEGSADALPEQRLANMLAKQKVDLLKANESQYF